jgi:SAM-dependent methyltransferase
MDEVVARALGNRPSPRPVGPMDRAEGTAGHHLHRALGHATLDIAAREKTRLKLLKRVILRAARVVTHQQVAFNHELVEACADVERRLNLVRSDFDQGIGVSRAAIASTELVLGEVVEAIERLEHEVDDLRAAAERAEERRLQDQAEVTALKTQVAFLREALSGPALDRSAFDRTDPIETPDHVAALYAQLEEQLRGPREEIKGRQRVYLDDVARLTRDDRPVLDVGCGRGEWLELLREHAIPAYGVDINEAFVKANLESGLDVQLADGLEHLASLAAGSLGGVSAMHVVEHLEFPVMVELVERAFVALAPDGVLILETPNPTNLLVGTSSFWMDPTHRRPVPPPLLEFVVRACGFQRVAIRFLNPPPEPPFRLPRPEGADLASIDRLSDTLNWALLGPLDYAVVARKA